MAWLQVILEPGERDPDALSELLSEAGALSVTLLDARDQPLYEPPPGATPLWSHTRVVGLFSGDADINGIRAGLAEALGEAALASLRMEPLEERDWTRAWMDDFQPMRFGKRLWVCPSNHPAPDPTAVNLLLDPGLAFGTGTHPTTALCLEWLDAHPCAGQTVVDYGCGSGILAIAALKLGAHRVWAVDNDPQALQATRDNADRNGVAGALKVVAPADLPLVSADLLLANILANPLMELAGHFATRLNHQGQVVLSGILEGQAAAVAAAYTAAGFDMQAPVVRDEWVRLSGRHVA